MKFTDLLVQDAMILDLEATTKREAIDEMIAALVATGRVDDAATFKGGILEREAQTTTGLGDGVAIPHAKNEAVREAAILFAKSKEGVDYDALDGQPVYVFFMIAVPAEANDTHLEALGSLSKYLMQDGFIAKLRAAKTATEVTALFTDKTVKEPPAKSDTHFDKFVVAVTACTTGIAHTYMAEEALKKQAAEMGVEIKVETNGASGVGNRLTAADIARAQGVIIAADKAVEMERFAGKPLINRPVKDGIRQPEELINLALDPQTSKYQGSGKSMNIPAIDAAEKLSIGQRFYKHLMSGVSTMLPFVIGGGIAIALAFLVDQTMGVPQEQLAQLGNYHELAAVFKNIGNAAFGFMLPVLAGYIAYSIAEKPGMVAGFVAGFMANNGMAFGKVAFGAGGAKTLALAGVPSGFLGALVGGFVAGGVVLLLKELFRKLPKSLAGVTSILLYPVLGVLLTGFLMLFINIPMSGINTGLDTFLNSLTGANAVLLGLLVGGMMAVDMGGPINKAAYVFGTGTLAASVTTGGSEVMAAVMAGGMVPPLAIFVAALLFRDKFTEQERKSAMINIIMGLSFITEGAIPFAAADPLRAIPSFVLGSALAGGLVALAGIKLMAPHGGIFVIALTNYPLFYLLCIAIGALTSGVLFGLLRKNVKAHAAQKNN